MQGLSDFNDVNMKPRVDEQPPNCLDGDAAQKPKTEHNSEERAWEAWSSG